MIPHVSPQVDARVEAWLSGSFHKLAVGSITTQILHVDLNEFNHCVAHLTAAEYEASRRAYSKRLASKTEYLEDAITGVHLKTDEQVNSKPGWEICVALH